MLILNTNVPRQSNFQEHLANQEQFQVLWKTNSKVMEKTKDHLVILIAKSMRYVSLHLQGTSS